MQMAKTQKNKATSGHLGYAEGNLILDSPCSEHSVLQRLRRLWHATGCLVLTSMASWACAASERHADAKALSTNGAGKAGKAQERAAGAGHWGERWRWQGVKVRLNLQPLSHILLYSEKAVCVMQGSQPLITYPHACRV